ncbi:zinc finger BED domain-containing protein [Epinephelus moara]|uniref:zinc finger BED domain-containing protein n=1 Tax=Epinephelus moara TaxID=300413 RepID=UPI00214E481B|nr:zinc finger BED domain-containing protein [Epinephelus moara]
MVRKRSVVWGFFKTIDSESVQCLLCGDFLIRPGQGTTTNLLRHLRVKHPTEVVKRRTGLLKETASIDGHGDMETEGDQICSVEVALEDGDGDGDTFTIENVAGVNSAINGIVEAAQGSPAEEMTHEEASDDRPVARRWTKRSLIWRHYEHLDSLAAARCRICMKKLKCFEGGSTSNLHRHMSKRHPEIFSQLMAGGQHPPPPCTSQDLNANGDTSTPPETVRATEKQRQFSVEVTLEDGDGDTFTIENEAGINSAINGILEATQGSPAEEITHEEASDDRPVTRRWTKRSLIWRHYEHLDSLAAARCRICKKKLKCFEGGSTSNLHRHMSKRHPEIFSQLMAGGQHPPPPHTSQDVNANGVTSTPPETVRATEKQRPFSAALKVSKASEGEKRVLRRERELIVALRGAQREEARALEHQRELLERLRAVNAREAAAEREQIESLRKAQLEEAEDLIRQREEVQKEKAELQKKWEELQQEREKLVLFSEGQ